MLGARLKGCARFGQAVDAAQVAPVGQRDAQVAMDPAEAVGERTVPLRARLLVVDSSDRHRARGQRWASSEGPGSLRVSRSSRMTRTSSPASGPEPSSTMARAFAMAMACSTWDCCVPLERTWSTPSWAYEATTLTKWV